MDSAALSLTCAGLGGAEEDDDGAVVGYAKGEHCLDNLKDLQRFLRRDDPQRREVFKQVCKWKIASRDLVPIIENYQADRNLVITAVKVLVFLTMPVEPSSENVAQQIEYLWDLKAALTRNVAMAVIVSLLEDPLDHLERASFTEDDWKLVQLVLTLFRNILAIQEITLGQKASGEATQLLCLADSFLELMFQENVMDLILVLTQHMDEPSGYLQQENLLLLEIFHYLFLGRDPELIARASTAGSKDGSKSLCKGNPNSASENSLRKIRNVQRGPQKRIAWDNELLYTPREGTMEMIRNFLEQFLSGGYNVLMQSVCDDIVKEHHSIQKSDITTFFKVARFVLAFQHEKASNAQKSNAAVQLPEASPSDHLDDNLPFLGDICGPVAATLNEGMFNLVISRWRETYDSLKETHDYKTLSAAGSLMKNMIDMVYLVLKVLPDDSRESQTARVLLYKLFYDQTEQGLTQFLLNLFRSFDTHKQPKSDLADLLGTIHIMLQLMEKLQARGALRVAKRTRKGRKKKASKNKIENTNLNAEKMEQSNADSTDGTKSALESLPDLKNVDSVAEPPLREQEKVVSNGMDAPDELTGTSVNLDSTSHCEVEPSCADNGELKGNLIDEEDGTSDSSLDDQPPATSEVDFNVSRLISTLANNSVVQNICWLLKHYKSNSFRTNHYIICMLRRFCEDLELAPMLYQMSLLTTFYDILADQKSSTSKEYTNIVNFLSKIVRKMLRVMKKQPLLFVDVLFWKTRKECHCIDADACLSDITKDGTNKGGEIGSSKGWRGSINIADSLGDDEVDLVIPHEPYNADKDDDSSSGEREDVSKRSMGATNKSNRILSFSDSEADDNDSSIQIDKIRNTVSRGSQNSEAPKRQGRSIFSEEQEKLMRDLYEKYKDDRKCTHLIAEALDPSGKITSVQVSRKLTQLGLRNAMKRRTKVPEAPLSAQELATQMDQMLGEHNCNPKPETTRRKRLNVSHASYEDNTTDGKSSDEETLQAIKSRTKNKKVPLVGLLPSISQHQDGLADPDSDDETIGSMLRSGKKKRLLTPDNAMNIEKHQESPDSTNTSNYSPEISQKQEALQDTYSGDEIIDSMHRSGKKKRLLKSGFTANTQEHEEPLINIGQDDETISSKDNLHHGLNSSNNSGGAGETELLDDFIEPELDNVENTEQRIIDDINITESGDMATSFADQKPGLKRRHKLVIDDDDD
uniref:Timeless N-terminal domain-containing protein n=1 Tax=Oryza nivara TaxID=4536 RepID=A0A0E0HB22_ORYNI